MNNESPLRDSIEMYYEQENKRRSEWLGDMMKEFTPSELYDAIKNHDQGAEEALRMWFKNEGFRIEISPDNLLIQIWKGNEQVAQYQTILPEMVKFIDGKDNDVCVEPDIQRN